MNYIAPLRNCPLNQKPWEGCQVKKPWEYPVSVALPLLDADLEGLKLIIELLRLQTLRPYILLIDTGSQEATELADLRADDLELHTINCHAYRHPSEPVSMALDLATAVNRSPYLFFTHSDCFLMRQDLLEEMKGQAAEHVVAGYEISPRPHDDWQGMVGHTCLMIDACKIAALGITWQMSRLLSIFPDIDSYEPHSARPNFPDTELTFNYLLRLNEIEPFISGHEENAKRVKDGNIDHCRSLTCSKLYAPVHYEKSVDWYSSAKLDAFGRIEFWKKGIPAPGNHP